MTHYLITGGAGFIGSHLVEACLQQHHQVTAIDDLSTGRFESIESFIGYPGFCFVTDSISDENVLNALVSEADIIVHLAAVVGVQLVMEQPIRMIETNVLGTEMVLKAALRYRTKVLIASSSEAYGKGVRIPFHEDDDILLGSTSMSRWAYATSKVLDEFLGMAYWHEHGLPVVLFRLFNTVGPRQIGRYGMVIPRLVQQALRGEPLTVYGDGSQRRAFCDVRDVVRAIMSLASSSEAAGHVFNIGGIEEVTIKELAKRVLELTGSLSAITFVPYTKVYGLGFEDIKRRVPDISRISTLTGWRPSFNLDETLLSVGDYFRKHPNIG